jgi:hypothetical protein
MRPMRTARQREERSDVPVRAERRHGRLSIQPAWPLGVGGGPPGQS